MYPKTSLAILLNADKQEVKKADGTLALTEIDQERADTANGMDDRC